MSSTLREENKGLHCRIRLLHHGRPNPQPLIPCFSQVFTLCNTFGLSSLSIPLNDNAEIATKSHARPALETHAQTCFKPLRIGLSSYCCAGLKEDAFLVLPEGICVIRQSSRKYYSVMCKVRYRLDILPLSHFSAVVLCRSL